MKDGWTGEMPAGLPLAAQLAIRKLERRQIAAMTSLRDATTPQAHAELQRHVARLEATKQDIIARAGVSTPETRVIATELANNGY